jgi:protein-tyrosine phosphatase
MDDPNIRERIAPFLPFLDDLQTPASSIIPGLYLGNVYNSADIDSLRSLRITHVLNVAAQCDCFFEEEIKYLHLKLYDSPRENIVKRFSECFKFIQEALDGGGNILVHCIEGVSRSASFVMAFIMHSHGIDYLEALTLVREKRCIVRPNQGFREQLINWSLSL